MNENPEETVRSTNPKFPGYAKRQEEGQWQVFRPDSSQVGFIMTTNTPEILDVAPLPQGNRPSIPDEVEGGFQQALTYCLENFRPRPTGG